MTIILTRQRALAEYRNVLRALILRDIKSRFMGSAWGYLVSIGWPLSHICVLLLVHGAFGRMQPYGDSAAVWYSTGIVPFMAFSYTMRFIVLGLMQNAPLLNFPTVKVVDIFIARAIVEIFSVFIVFVIISIILEAFDSSFLPKYPVIAFYSILLSFALGFGFGIIFACLSRISPAWNVVSILFIMILWSISGIFFVPTYLPSYIIDILYYNPIMHIIDLFRSAYYDEFAEGRARVNYVVMWCIVVIGLALLFEKIIRGRLMQ